MAHGHASQMASALDRVFKRHLTGMERGLVARYYRSRQLVLRALSLIPLVLSIVTIILIFTGMVPLALSCGLSVLAIVLSIVVVSMSIGFFVKRMKTSAILKDGTGIEVRGSASADPSARKNAPSFIVGPITLFLAPKDSGLVHDGAQVRVLYVPKLNAALSVDDTGLAHGARITCQQDLEAMLEPSGGAAQETEE